MFFGYERGGLEDYSAGLTPVEAFLRASPSPGDRPLRWNSRAPIPEHCAIVRLIERNPVPPREALELCVSGTREACVRGCHLNPRGLSRSCSNAINGSASTAVMALSYGPASPLQTILLLKLAYDTPPPSPLSKLQSIPANVALLAMRLESLRTTHRVRGCLGRCGVQTHASDPVDLVLLRVEPFSDQAEATLRGSALPRGLSVFSGNS